jgi:hypothetical protein
MTMLSRLDLVFLAGMVGLWVILHGHLLRFFLPLDIASIIIAVLLAFTLRVDLPAYYQHVDIALTMVALALLVKIPCAYLFGLYHRATILNVRQLSKQLLLSSLLSSVIVATILLAALRIGVLEGSFSRLTLVIDFAFTLLLLGISRSIYLGLQPKRSPMALPEEKPLTDLRTRWRQWVREGGLYYGIVLGALGIYMVWNKLAFGTASRSAGRQAGGHLYLGAYGGSARSASS